MLLFTDDLGPRRPRETVFGFRGVVDQCSVLNTAGLECCLSRAIPLDSLPGMPSVARSVSPA